jgi:hypothetical protein
MQVEVWRLGDVHFWMLQSALPILHVAVTCARVLCYHSFSYGLSSYDMVACRHMRVSCVSLSAILESPLLSPLIFDISLRLQNRTGKGFAPPSPVP